MMARRSACYVLLLAMVLTTIVDAAKYRRLNLDDRPLDSTSRRMTTSAKGGSKGSKGKGGSKGSKNGSKGSKYDSRKGGKSKGSKKGGSKSSELVGEGREAPMYPSPSPGEPTIAPTCIECDDVGFSGLTSSTGAAVVQGSSSGSSTIGWKETVAPLVVLLVSSYGLI